MQDSTVELKEKMEICSLVGTLGGAGHLHIVLGHHLIVENDSLILYSSASHILKLRLCATAHGSPPSQRAYKQFILEGTYSSAHVKSTDDTLLNQTSKLFHFLIDFKKACYDFRSGGWIDSIRTCYRYGCKMFLCPASQGGEGHAPFLAFGREAVGVRPFEGTVKLHVFTFLKKIPIL